MTAVYDRSLHVELGTRSYAIDIVDGPVARPHAHGEYWSRRLSDLGTRDLALVTNDTLAPIYGAPLAAHLQSSGFRVEAIVLPDGEAHKHAASLEVVHTRMLEARFDRKVVVLALGGGVIGDVAGFAAATYQRGVRFVQIPTTLLAQVDSSVGGKTGINHPLGKNMVGAFHQPSAVVIDLATLSTLPAREFSAGLAEVIKYGIALDVDFFAWLELNMPALMARDRDAMTYAVRRSCEIKARIVGEDERESGARALLNFGHTFGHAIEGAMGYGAWLHGEAVAAGMMIASRLSKHLGAIDDRTLQRIARLLLAAQLPTAAPRLAEDAWFDWMLGDKKSEGGRIRFVVLDALGASQLTAVDDAIVADVLRASGSVVEAPAEAPVEAAPR